MTSSNPKQKGYEGKENVAVTLVMLVVMLIGIVLILISLQMPDGLLRDAISEFGIVILSVFAVSLLYEVTLAKKHLSFFLSQLQEHIKKGESNMAMCAYLGIKEIYSSRTNFEAKNPLESFLDGLGPNDELFTTGRSLFVFMTKAHFIKRAIDRGATVNLCVFDPTSSLDEISLSPDLEVSDIQSTVAIFVKQISEWVKSASPAGKVELRFHHIPVLDSCLFVRSRNNNLCIWDLSFGRDLGSKRIFILDPDERFGLDLKDRYTYIWDKAKKIYEYDGKSIIIDNTNLLSTIVA